MDHFLSLFAPARLGSGGLSIQNFTGQMRKSFDPVPGSKTLVVCLPGWGQKLWSLALVKRYVRGSGKSFLAYEFPRGVLSDQKELTKDLFEMVAAVARSDIASLRNEYGFDRCVLVGVSLGCAMGAMVYKENPDIDEAILVIPGENVARDLWHGCRTQHLWRSYERQNVSLEELEHLWFGLAPEHNFPDNKTSVSLYFAKRDKVIPYALGLRLYEALSAKRFAVSKEVFPSGHYAVAVRFLLFPGRFLD